MVPPDNWAVLLRSRYNIDYYYNYVQKVWQFRIGVNINNFIHHIW
jgi:hypothetical protein